MKFQLREINKPSYNFRLREIGGDGGGFDSWYADVSSKNNLDPNPDDPRHFYDYRAAYRDGVRAPDETGHWPSKYKTDGHPRMVVDGVNTKTGKRVSNPDSATLLDRARNISPEPKTGDLSIIPYATTRATKGAMDHILLPAMEAVGLPSIGIDTRKTLDTAIEYWDKRVKDGTAKSLIGDTAELTGAMAPISKAMQAGWLVAKQIPKARPFFQSIVKGMVGGALLGEGDKDKTLENAALFGVFEPLAYAVGKVPEVPKIIKDSTAWRRMTIKERGLVLQSLDDMVTNNAILHYRNGGFSIDDIVKTTGKSREFVESFLKQHGNAKPMTEGEILRKWKNPEWRKQATGKRATGESGDAAGGDVVAPKGPIAPKPTEPAAPKFTLREIKPEEPNLPADAKYMGRDTEGRFVYQDSEKKLYRLTEQAKLNAPEATAEGVPAPPPGAVAEPAPAAPPLRTETTPRPSGAGEAKQLPSPLSLRERMRELQQQALQRDVEAEKVASEFNGKPIVLTPKLDSSRGSLIHKSTKHPGKIQVTRWDAKGFVGDSTYDTIEEAIKETMRDGDVMRNSAAFDKATKSRKFHGYNKAFELNRKYQYGEKGEGVIPLGDNSPESVAKQNGIVFRHIQEGNPHNPNSKPSYSFYDPLTKEAIGGKEPDFSVTNLEDVPRELAKIRASRGLKLLDDGTLGKIASKAPTETVEALKDAAKFRLREIEGSSEAPRGNTDIGAGTAEAEVADNQGPKSLIPSELQPAIEIMKSEVTQGEVAKNEFGHRVGSSYPKWFRDNKLTRRDFDTIINKLESGKHLTDKQFEVWQKIESSAKRISGEHPDLVADADIADMKKRGFDPVMGEMRVDDINEGDKILVQDGRYDDVLTHKGIGKDGMITLEDGQTIKVDPWDTVEVEGIKRGKKEGLELKQDKYGKQGRKVEGGIKSSRSKKKLNEDTYFNTPSSRDTAQSGIPFENPRQPNLFGGGKTPSGYADTGGYSNIPNMMELPEIVRLAKLLMDGKYPRIVKKLRTDGAVGTFYPGQERIDIVADIFQNPMQAAKTLAHEIGHVVDWLPDKDLKRGNILGRIASLKKFMGRYLAEKPGGEPPLSDADKIRLRNEAKRLLQKNVEKLIDEEIIKTVPIKPEDILAIWTDAINGSAVNKDLYNYIAGLNTAEKKSIIKEAMKGLVPDELEQFSKTIKTKTGRKIRTEFRQEATKTDIEKKFQELLIDEIKKRKLMVRDEITDELKNFTQAWKPFDPMADPKYTAYRFSSSELYADALSALITNPNYLRATAPKFYEGFFNYLESKPGFKQIYEQIQNEIRSGDVHKKRVESLRNGFAKREKEYREIVKARHKPLKSKEAWGTAFVDQYFSTISRVKKVGESNIPDDFNPRYKVEAMVHSGSEAEGYLTDMNADVIHAYEKLGATHIDFGEYLYHRRVTTERSNLANPEGFTPKISLDRMSEMEKMFPGIEDIADKFTEIRNEWVVEKIVDSQMHSPELVEYIKNNPNYANFDIVGHLEKSYGREATSVIFQQVGTFKSTGNPFTATLMNDMVLMRAVNRNNAAKSVGNFLQEYFPDEIKPAKINQHGNFNAPGDPNQRTLEYLDNGVRAGWHVPRYIGESFERNPVEANLLAEILRVTWSPFRALWTELNPGFWMTNLGRDAMRTLRNMPEMGVMDLPKYYAKGFMPSMRSVFGKPDETVKQMLKSDMLISVADYRSDNREDYQLERILKRYHLNQKVWEHNVLKPIWKLFYWVSGTARGIERLPKVAAYQYMKDKFPDMKIGELRHKIITQPGSPAFLRRGTQAPIYNNLLPFSNAMKEGYRGDWNAGKERKAEYMWKAAKYTLLPKLLQYGVSVGFAGVATKALLDRASDYDKANYIVIPIGSTPSGKAVYLRIPQDETGRLMGGVLWKVLNKDKKELLQNLTGYMSGQVPQLHPMFDVLYNVAAYASGQNPYDSFRERFAVPERIFEAGGARSHKEFAKYMANKLGSGIVYKFSSNNNDGITTELEELLGYPLASNILGRFIKVSDYGVHEKNMEEVEDLRKAASEQSILRTEAASKIISDRADELTEKEITAMIEKWPSMEDTLKRAIAVKYGNVYVRDIEYARNKAERAVIINRMLSDELVKRKIK